MNQLQTARPRKTCPNCGSVRLRKRVMVGSYICEGCNWRGRIPIKKMVSTRHLIPPEDRINHLASIHLAHPDWERKDLLKVETEHIVDMYMKGAMC